VAWETIRKDHLPDTSVNLADYDQAVWEFSWEAARARLDGLPGGRGLNIGTRRLTGTRPVRVRR
jgi:acetyl-CoA synthetase